jgi:hypothetical protein
MFAHSLSVNEEARAQTLTHLRSIETASKMQKERNGLIQAGAVQAFLNGLKACTSTQSKETDDEMLSAFLSALYGGKPDRLRPTRTEDMRMLVSVDLSHMNAPPSLSFLFS